MAADVLFIDRCQMGAFNLLDGNDVLDIGGVQDLSTEILSDQSGTDAFPGSIDGSGL